MDTFEKFITKFKRGDVLYRKGDIQTEFFIINKGKVQLKISDEDFVITVLSKGDFFGEESLNNEQNAAYTVEVIEDADIIKIPYTNLTEMMKQNTEIALKILKKLSEKHLKMQNSLYTQISSPLPEKGKAAKADAKAEEQTSEKIDDAVKAYLNIQRSNRTVQLTKAQTFLGRRDYTTGFIPDVDLTEEDEEKYISRKHAKIIYSDGKFFFSEEPGAINGTFLNGNKLKTGVKYEIHNKDELTLCHLNVIFKI